VISGKKSHFPDAVNDRLILIETISFNTTARSAYGQPQE
jgi:hypothetical protein